MTPAVCEQPNRARRDEALLIYDGECRFCINSVQRITAHWPPRPAAVAVTWQSLGPVGLTDVGINQADASRAAWWVGTDGSLLRGHLAIAAALEKAGGWRRRLGLVIGWPMVSPLARAVYAAVARWRRHLPVPHPPRT